MYINFFKRINFKISLIHKSNQCTYLGRHLKICGSRYPTLPILPTLPYIFFITN